MSAVTALRIVAGIAIVLTLVLLLVGVAEACERPHHDGIALWCCPAEPGPCELVGFVDGAVST